MEDEMSITATEFKENLGKYLDLAGKEDIYISKNGKIIARLTEPFSSRVDDIRSIFGILPDDMTAEEARDERLSRI